MSRRGRKSGINYWKSRKAFCCWIDGKQHTLATGPDDEAEKGPTFRAAVARFQSLISLGDADRAGDGNTIKVVCELYLRFVETRRSPGTLKIRRERLAEFVRAHGELPAGELTHAIVYRFVDRMKTEPRQVKGRKRYVKWNETTARYFVVSLIAAIRWAVKSGIVTTNRLAGIEMPKERRRVTDVLVSPDQHKAILAAAKPHFRRLLVCLEATGCRPGELLNARAEDFDRETRAIIYPASDRRSANDSAYRHKTATKGKDRVIILTGDALDIVRGLVEANPTGPLFRRPNGRPITANNFKKALTLIRKKVNMPNLIPYSYRHTYATAWIKAGRSIDHLAEVLGNTPETIRKSYSHLNQCRDSIRAAVEEFRAGR